ncbi:MAG: TM2 domain-containing protein, partial [Pirellulaceae bacterium]|nr:TM2 domain-containing protein [Pirellulaceae bacterium]
KTKVVAGILGILLGPLGIHHFYLGSTTLGIIYLCVTILSCSFAAPLVGVLALVEGIIALVMSDEDFDAKYNQRTPEAMEFVFSNPHK